MGALKGNAEILRPWRRFPSADLMSRNLRGIEPEGRAGRRFFSHCIYRINAYFEVNELLIDYLGDEGGPLMKGMIISILGVIVMSGTAFSGGDRGGVAYAADQKAEKATFAVGCFWCMEPPFDKVDGVLSTTVGYTGGKEKDPTYEQVSSGQTGHLEAIEILYDPERVTYERLLDVFWKNVDPTQGNGQFVDIGPQYRTAIFYHNDAQRRLAEASKKKLEESGKFGKKVATQILPATEFYRAEEYHQDYYEKNPLRYKYYRWGSGRDQFLEKAWGK
jgi:methionine-S-sulfoxide reductase